MNDNECPFMVELQAMNKSKMEETSKRSSREIDHIFTDARVEMSMISKGSYISDHMEVVCNITTLRVDEE